MIEDCLVRRECGRWTQCVWYITVDQSLSESQSFNILTPSARFLVSSAVFYRVLLCLNLIFFAYLVFELYSFHSLFEFFVYAATTVISLIEYYTIVYAPISIIILLVQLIRM